MPPLTGPTKRSPLAKTNSPLPSRVSYAQSPVYLVRISHNVPSTYTWAVLRDVALGVRVRPFAVAAACLKSSLIRGAVPVFHLALPVQKAGLEHAVKCTLRRFQASYKKS